MKTSFQTKCTGKRLVLVAASFLAVAAFALIPPRHTAKESDAERTVIPVSVQTVSRRDIWEYMLLNGDVKAANTVSVYPDVAGKVLNVPVSLGSPVRRGQLLAEVDPSVPGVVYLKNPVLSPIEGFVTSLPLTPGTTVTRETEIARIGNISELRIEAKVPESRIADLKEGLSAEVSLAPYKDAIFAAHVYRVSPIVDEISRAKEIYLSFDSPDERINAGMYVRIKLNTRLHENALVVPSDAIVLENGKPHVFTVVRSENDVSAIRQEIAVRSSVDSLVIVQAGLSIGETIVVSGVQSLSDGSPVRILEEP